NIIGPGIESSITNFKNIIGRSSDGILHLRGGNTTGPIYLNYYESGNISLANGGGNVGIGTLNPSAKLEVNGNIKGPGLESSLINFKNIIGRSSDGILHLRGGNTTGPIYLNYYESGNISLANGGGNVGIGTITTDAKLTVKGDIHAQEVKVDLNGAIAPDFVFANNYTLRSLEETETYISMYHHLPEIPSASEMEKNGFELKEMNLRLLQKVEELTLYLIEQNKQIQELKKEVSSLKNE
ncbi:MAG: hypothetical protein ABJN84_13820, partial [Flavobacteriaceae bacterium]